jgi:thimet oligopeptidase
MFKDLRGLMSALFSTASVLAAADAGAAAPAAPLRTVADLSAPAARAKAVMELPRYETTPAEFEATRKREIAAADRRLAAIVAQDKGKATFESTVGALDDALHPIGNVAYRFSLLKEVEPEAALRAAATDQLQAVQEWFVGLTYREDVYAAVAAFDEAYRAGQRPKLAGDALKLYEDTMRDYRRAGLHLPKEQRDKLESLNKELARISTEFDRNISEAKVVVTYDAAELEGVPASFLESVRTPEGRYDLLANVTPHYLVVTQNAKREAARRRMEEAHDKVAQEKNTVLLDRLVALRDEIASRLGYASWADYRIEPKMAKTTERAAAFLEDLVKGLEPKFRAEVDAFRAMKVRDTGDPAARIEAWDWRYYENQLKKEKYQVDAEALRPYFEFERTLAGMFDIYQRIFGLKFEQLRNDQPWAPGVNLYAAIDEKTGEPMGLFYLDNFPRDGKYNHFAQFTIAKGRVRPDGLYERPVVALVCNFAAPTAKEPSLLSHREVQTLFHEFGHALHSLTTRARFADQSQTSVPGDFVEAPSQMLEHWVWDPATLNRFAAHWQDPSKKIDPALIERLKEARKATAGVYYRRQLALGTSDLALHARPQNRGGKDAQTVLNEATARVFIAPPAGTHFGAGWGHLTGYDAGYYGYLWAEAISADMASVFRQAPNGLMDVAVGRRLRDEIYAVGGSRDAEESIRRFLGREPSSGPFLQELGLPAPSGGSRAATAGQ